MSMAILEVMSGSLAQGRSRTLVSKDGFRTYGSGAVERGGAELGERGD